MLALQPEWRLLLTVAGVTFAISLACLTASDKTARSVRWCMLIAVSIASAWLLWLGLYPSMYYMASFSLVIMLWGGVLASCLIITITSLAISGSVARGTKTTIEERALLIIPLVTTLLLAFQIPLRLGAATAIPTLASKINESGSGRSVEQQRCGLYTVRLSGRHRGRTLEQVYFVLVDDSESAFVYSPSGIDNIFYNAGSKGHLFGDWYWIKED
jgi:hypothetical protein